MNAGYFMLDGGGIDLSTIPRRVLRGVGIEL